MIIEYSLTAQILVVDDASSYVPESIRVTRDYESIESIEVISLISNQGNQRAIAIALSYLHDRGLENDVLIMDSDGEDKPEDIPRLVAELVAQPTFNIIFAERNKRSEGYLFKILYTVYQGLFNILLGIKINFGNFSIVRKEMVSRLIQDHSLWNHYPATVIKNRIAYTTINTERGARYFGRPKMSFANLVLHGLAGIACFNEKMLCRLLIFSSIVLCSLILTFFVVIGLKLFTTLAIAGWASNIIGFIIVLALQIIVFSALFSFGTIANRSVKKSIPGLDYHFYIKTE